MRRALAPFLTFVFIVMLAATALAQDTTPTTFDQLKADYAFKLEIYREAEDTFNLDRAEFYKLDTLASKEKAVISLKNLMIARVEVLQVYLTALETLLNSAPGIDPTEKQIAIQDLQSSQNFLSTHKQAIPSLSEQESVLAESESFEENISGVDRAIYRTLSLISLGRIQNAYDLLLSHTDQFKTDYVQPLPDSSRKDFVLRGLKDVDAQNTLAQQAITKAEESFSAYNNTDSRRRSDSPRNTYSNTVKNLQPAYSAMQKSVRFLKELDRQT